MAAVPFKRRQRETEGEEEIGHFATPRRKFDSAIRRASSRLWGRDMPVITEIKDYSDNCGNVISGTPAHCANVRVDFTAKNCRIEIGPSASLQNCTISMSADNGLIRIGARSSVKCAMRVGLNSSIIIGERLSSTGGGIISAAESTSVVIGDDCMFGVSMDIRSDHSHPIFDRLTSKRLNKSKSTVIGNHVWLGPHVLIYPGAEIGEGSVIGARSLVHRKIPPNCVAVGVPARVTRRDIVWDKSHVAVHAPWMFDSLSDVPNPWQSRFPVGPEIEDRPRAWRRLMAAIPLLGR